MDAPFEVLISSISGTKGASSASANPEISFHVEVLLRGSQTKAGIVRSAASNTGLERISPLIQNT